VLRALKPGEPGQWTGHIYNAEDGQTYDSHVKLTGAGRLRVEGCVMGIMCGGETWTRAGAAPVVAPERPASSHATTGAGRPKRSIAEETSAQVCSAVARR
jgi:hypothetical protein